MKPGDLVKYKVPEEAKHQPGAGDNRPVGIIVDVKETFHSGGGGAWMSTETLKVISWSSDKGIWITNEREENLEVFSEDR